LERIRSWGWIGVDLFFVISGYLITSILLAAKTQPGYYRNFYARRCLRIWPLYYLLLFFVFVLSPHLGMWARQDYNPQIIHWPYYLFYIQNLVYPHLGSFSLVITWSLCVEEQFYCVWPLVVRRCSNRTLAAVALCVLLAGTPFRMYLHHIASSMGFFFTLTRLDTIAVGALVALRPRWFRYTWLAAPVAVWLLWAGNFDLVYLALALTFGSALMHAVTKGSAVLRWAWLRFIGRISYGLYIVHPAVFSIFWLTPLYAAAEHWPHANLIRMVGQMAFPIPFAALSWYLFEQPILKFKKWFEADSTVRVARGSVPWPQAVN
jgi:peptidoglycan/LPS O-acetylase OafA/YrhL